MDRRTTLKLGVAGLAGGGLANLLRLRDASAADRPLGNKPLSNCILIWMDGGPTHFETFDPKPEAPAEIRGEFSAIETNVSGIRISEHLPKLAKMADKYAIVRSVCHNQVNHGAGNHYMMISAIASHSGRLRSLREFHPSMGSVAARERNAPHGLPAYFSMPGMSRSGGPNFLGAKYAPFVVSNDPNSDRFRVRDVALPDGILEPRFQSRRDLRSVVDKMPRYTDPAVADPVMALDEYYQQGYDLITTPAAQKAFDIQSEPKELREAYGRNGFGQRALLARRLVEAGVPFVTIVDGGWDHHSDLFGALRTRLPTWDQTVATLISDLDSRGLLETTMVIALGEFGRTPKISTLAGQSKAGRDHWANAMSILFAGGGTPGGQVIGATDRQGHSAVERVLAPENFVSTVYMKMGINPDKFYVTPTGRPSHLVSDPTPIKELM
ncbi:MAG: DUF1501 domain-containing protein [Pirellulales bacterium]